MLCVQTKDIRSSRGTAEKNKLANGSNRNGATNYMCISHLLFTIPLIVVTTNGDFPKRHLSEYAFLRLARPFPAIDANQ